MEHTGCSFPLSDRGVEQSRTSAFAHLPLSWGPDERQRHGGRAGLVCRSFWASIFAGRRAQGQFIENITVLPKSIFAGLARNEMKPHKYYGKFFFWSWSFETTTRVHQPLGLLLWGHRPVKNIAESLIRMVLP